MHFVREHIKSFPAEESHYSRTENPAAQCLSGDLTLAHMYRLYVQKCTEEEKLPVKESFYRNVFMTEFNPIQGRGGHIVPPQVNFLKYLKNALSYRVETF